MSAAALAAPVAPSGLSVFVDRTTANKADPANDTYVFLWNDNSTDETSFVITYNIPGFTPGTLTTVPSTSTSTTGGTGELVFINTNIIPVGTTAQWQVAAVNASGTSTASNVASSTVLAAQLVAPTSVTATVTNENTINVTWSDTSTSAEGNELWLSTNGGAYTYQGDVLFYQAKSINISGLAPGTPYQVKLRAYQDPATQGGARTYTAYSAPSATITTKDGFTSGTAPPIFYNQAFSYQAVVSTGSSRSSWSITGLPTGLTFNSSTGAITGTPTVTGAFNCPMSATFANGWTTNNTLQLRVIRAAAAPVAATTIATQTLAAGGNTSVSLTDKFSDPDSESAVRIVTNLGTMDFILYNSATPQTVTNFLSYVNAAVNNYNGAVFHRSVPGFVVQGGGFKVQSEPNNFSSIPTSASPINEPGISNLRGTVAMAKVGTNPNSATNQFFVNLGNNSSNLDRDSGSPNANGGFTAFARVAGSGMTVADAMAGLPTVNSSVNVDGTPNTSLTDWPLTSASASMDTTKVVSISSAAPVAVLSYAVTGNTNSAVASAAISGTNVQINALSGGQTDVTVTATDLDGNTMAQTFTVTVNQMPAFTNGPPSSTAVVGTAYNFAYTASGFPAPVFSHTGTLPPGLSLSSEGVISGTPTTAGTYSNIVVTASNGVGTAATQTISITVDQIPAITSAAPAAGVVGTAYNHTYAATGSPAPTYSLTAGALPGGLSLSSVGVISGTPTTAGTFTGTITATNLVGSSPQAFSITIQKAAATVALGSLAQTYTGSPLAATSTTTPSNLNVTYTYDGSSTTPTNAGSYAVVATINEPNYTGTASGTLVIAKAAATLSLGGLAQTFDGSAKTVSATTTPAGLTVAFTYNGSATAPTNAGSYAVVGTISEANYSGSDSGTLVIAKAAATVSLGSLAQTYDGSAKAATATTSPTGLTVNFTYDGSATAPTNAGSYAVIGTISDTNYAGASPPGTLVIAKATAGVTLGNLTQAYDGNPKPASASTSPAGLSVSLTYNGSSTAPSSHGSYTVAATVNDANYNGSNSSTLIIQGQSSAGWRAQHFSPEQITAGLAADDADPDGDGWKNLAEYALGMNPTSRNPALLPVRDANGLTLTFTRPKDMPDVTYGAQSTDNFDGWDALTLELVSDGPVQTMRARDPLTSGNPSRRIMQLIFNLPPPIE